MILLCICVWEKRILKLIWLSGCVIKTSSTLNLPSHSTYRVQWMLLPCLFTSAPSKINKPRKWPCCRETHGFCIMYNSSRPDDALMGSHMEELAKLPTATRGRNQKEDSWSQGNTNHDRKQGRFWLSVSGGKDQPWIHVRSGSPSVFCHLRLACPFISSAVTSHFEISYATSLFNTKKKQLHAFLTYSSSCTCTRVLGMY